MRNFAAGNVIDLDTAVMRAVSILTAFRAGASSPELDALTPAECREVIVCFVGWFVALLEISGQVTDSDPAQEWQPGRRWSSEPR